MTITEHYRPSGPYQSIFLEVKKLNEDLDDIFKNNNNIKAKKNDIKIFIRELNSNKNENERIFLDILSNLLIKPLGKTASSIFGNWLIFFTISFIEENDL